MTDPYRLTARQALALMQKGDLTVEDYAKSLLARTKERNEVVKAWAYLDPDFCSHSGTETPSNTS